MGFGDKFMNAINKIYAKQRASIQINKEVTEEFLVGKGMRQGCPLSPLLFIIILQVLLKEIQRDEQFIGIKIKNHYFKY